MSQRIRLLWGVLGLLLVATSARAQGSGSVGRSLGEELTRTLLWLAVAGVLFFLTFKIVDWTTPGDLKQQLAEGNVALAIYVGSLAIAAAILIGHLLG